VPVELMLSIDRGGPRQIGWSKALAEARRRR